MDLNLNTLGPAPGAERLETPLDKKIQSAGGFSGVEKTADKQLQRALGQAEQKGDARFERQDRRGELIIDEKTRRVYLQTKDPVTGEVQKFPSEAQLRLAAQLKEEYERKATAVKTEETVVTGELLDAKA